MTMSEEKEKQCINCVRPCQRELCAGWMEMPHEEERKSADGKIETVRTNRGLCYAVVDARIKDYMASQLRELVEKSSDAYLQSLVMKALQRIQVVKGPPGGNISPLVTPFTKQ
jgi:hypothetical protein